MMNNFLPMKKNINSKTEINSILYRDTIKKAQEKIALNN